MRERYPTRSNEGTNGLLCYSLRMGDTAVGAIKREAAFVIAPVNGICLGAPRILGVSPQWADAGVTSKSVIIRGSAGGGGRATSPTAVHPCKTAAAARKEAGERG